MIIRKVNNNPEILIFDTDTFLNIIQTTDLMACKESVEINFGKDYLPIGRYKHTSISALDRYPSWDELKQIKEELHGNGLVLQVLPPKSHYVNIHQNCFHLWEYLGENK